ncbi:hypothetical protein [Embleya sp. NBC_00896]|uniref:hypothetical protein n=1 Tax=Embleya sp. NBC_00896 TaxID=2975961 RepID=UPI00386C6797|nr:hypothetical protein OG928_00365 [Embleya sp. NBC_00896]
MKLTIDCNAQGRDLIVHDDPANDPVDDKVISHFSSAALAGGTARPQLKAVAR